MEDLRLADCKGDYTTTWKIVHDLSRKDKKKKKIQFEFQQKRRHPTIEWQRPTLWMEGILSASLNNSILSYIGDPPSGLPPPAAQDLLVETDPPTRDSFSNSRSGEQQDWQIRQHVTVEALPNGGDTMTDLVHDFCTKVSSNLIPPSQRTTSIIVPLPEKGDLSLMTNYRGISLLSITAKENNKILLNRIRENVEPILRRNQVGFRSGGSCAQQLYILRRIMEGFQDYQLPFSVTFIDFYHLSRLFTEEDYIRPWFGRRELTHPRLSRRYPVKVLNDLQLTILLYN